MANVIIKPGWQARECDATPEHVFMERRRFLKSMGFLGAAALLGASLPGCARAEEQPAGPEDSQSPLSELPAPVTRNETYAVSERGLTPYRNSTRYNNFYEFTTTKEEVARLAGKLTTSPWSIDVKGLVKKPATIDLAELLKKFPLEERIYRFRCVEAWAMTVPWVGFPLAKFIEHCEPTSAAKYVAFVTLLRPREMVGQATQNWYNWPYYEALRLDEAMNELALMTVGMYGKVLPNQNGAPVRIITPWKYGYKSIKSVVEVVFTDKQPSTFWNDLAANEYGFYSNVNPKVPHPRWSQATERLIDSGKRVPTLPYNGYGEYVASLYKGGEI